MIRLLYRESTKLGPLLGSETTFSTKKEHFFSERVLEARITAQDCWNRT